MNTQSFQLRRWQFINWFDSLLILVVRYALLALGVVAVATLLSGIFLNLAPVLISLSILFLAPLLLVAVFSWYVHYLKTHPEHQIDQKLRHLHPLNNFDYPSLAAVMALQRSRKWRPFWQKLASVPLAGELLLRLGLSAELTSNLMAEEPVEADRLMTSAISAAEGQMVTAFSLLRATFALPTIQGYLIGENIMEADIETLLAYYEGQYQLSSQLKNEKRAGGFARTWAVSYTNLLDAIAPPLPDTIIHRAAILPIYSRSKTVDEIIVQLNSGNMHNVVITGPEGIGKTELFYHLAGRVYQAKTKTALDGLDVRSLNINRLLTLASNPDELQQVVTAAFNEIIRAGNVVLFIDHLELLLAPEASIGTVDLAAVLQGMLENGRVRIVATMTNQKYLELVQPNSQLAAAFYRAEVPVPDQSELLGVVLSHLPRLEHHYQTFFLITAVQELIALGQKYIKDQVSPVRELNLAETTAANVQAQSRMIITPEDVSATVEQKAKVPITVKAEENKTLLNLEASLHRRVIGQQAAVKQVSDALLRARAGLQDGTKPIGTFLFLGPTGVGKTETAKALAEIYFGSTAKLIRLDMTEYADAGGLQKLLGRDAKLDPGALALAVQQNPSSVILFDEIEKADQMTKNALLPLLDEGRLTTNYGQVLDFTNTIVIATSNAGSDFIRSQVQAGLVAADFERRLMDQLITSKIFLTEFLNRFDGVIVFTPLSPTEIQAVVGLQINDLKNRIYKEKGIAIEFAPAVLNALAEKGYDPVFGARALQRVMANDLETVIARKIISESPKAGSKIQIDTL